MRGARALIAIGALLGLRGAAAACEVWNASAAALKVGAGSWEGDVYAFDHVSEDGAIQRVHVARPGAPIVKLACGGRDAVKLGLDGDRVVVSKLPRGFTVALERRTATITVTGPKKTAVVIDGAAVTAVKGRFVAVPELRRALLRAEIGVVPTLFPYGDVLVPVVATAGKLRYEVAVLVSAGPAVNQLGQEAEAVADRPLGWGAPVAGAAPHPALLVRRTGSALDTLRYLPAGGLGHLGDVQLVAVGKPAAPADRVVSTCRYETRDGPVSFDRVRDVVAVSVYEALTGKLVARQDFHGDDPPECPATVTVTAANRTGSTLAGPLADEGIVRWLAGL